jgi:hypothetical protein
MIPFNLAEKNKSEQKAIFVQICKAANEMACQACAHTDEMHNMGTVAFPENGPKEEFEEIVNSAPTINGQLCELLEGFFWELPNDDLRVTFLSTTVNLADNRQGCSIANLMVGAFLMRFKPENFMGIFEKINLQEDYDWFIEIFLQFLAIKPYKKYYKMDISSVIHNNNRYIPISHCECDNEIVCLNKLSDDIFKWLTKKSEECEEGNLGKFLGKIMICDIDEEKMKTNVILTFGKTDFLRLAKLFAVEPNGPENWQYTLISILMIRGRECLKYVPRQRFVGEAPGKGPTRLHRECMICDRMEERYALITRANGFLDYMVNHHAISFFRFFKNP